LGWKGPAEVIYFEMLLLLPVVKTTENHCVKSFLVNTKPTNPRNALCEMLVTKIPLAKHSSALWVSLESGDPQLEKASMDSRGFSVSLITQLKLNY